ncbi:MAG: hypothetical protein ACJA01_001123 [Saprospiraceae bacterium]|jgi:hypothetical protein
MEEDTFSFESTDFKIITVFERDDSQKITGLNFIRENSRGTGIIYATRQRK